MKFVPASGAATRMFKFLFQFLQKFNPSKESIEDYAEKQMQKAEKEIKKAAKRFGETFDAELYRETNPRVKGYIDEAPN